MFGNKDTRWVSYDQLQEKSFSTPGTHNREFSLFLCTLVFEGISNRRKIEDFRILDVSTKIKVPINNVVVIGCGCSIVKERDRFVFRREIRKKLGNLTFKGWSPKPVSSKNLTLLPLPSWTVIYVVLFFQKISLLKKEISLNIIHISTFCAGGCTIFLK